jgi:ADP-sugar diphosphatase
MLKILQVEEEYNVWWIIMTEQPWIAAGSLSFWKIPAGMLDDSDSFAGAAARKIEEEVGSKLEGKDLIVS